MDLKDIEKRIDRAIDIRERGDLIKSRDLFESILKDVKKLLQKESSKEFVNIYSKIMGEYIIQHRHEAKDLYYLALNMGKDLMEFDRKKGKSRPTSIRAVSNTLINLGNFEEAEMYLEKLLPIYADNSARLGDVKSHLAYCFFRQGKLDKGLALIDEALVNIEENNLKEQYVGVWLSRALMFKSWMLYAKGELKEALRLARKALNISKGKELAIRTKQAKEILDFLKSVS